MTTINLLLDCGIVFCSALLLTITIITVIHRVVHTICSAYQLIEERALAQRIDWTKRIEWYINGGRQELIDQGYLLYRNNELVY